MKLKNTLAAASAVLMTTAIAGAQMDLTSLPPAPAEMCQKIAATEHSLAQCIEIAEKSVGGEAAAATLDLDGAVPQAVVTVYTDAARHDVVINVANGSVLKDTTASRFPGWELTDQEMHTTDSGLMYFIMEEGKGAKPGGPAAVVEVHYTGYLVDGTKFDSSHDRGQTIEFPLNRVIRGWTEGVGMMLEGEKRKLIIPSDLGYGQRGSPGAIPPNAMLVFDVELVSVVSGAE